MAFIQKKYQEKLKFMSLDVSVTDLIDSQILETKDSNDKGKKKGKLEKELSRIEKLDKKKPHHFSTKEKDSHRDSVRSSERKGYLSSSENYESEDNSDVESSKNNPPENLD